MTDTEQRRIEEICKVAHIEDISELSDGYHTFNQLYYQRMMLFAALVKQNRNKAWKSLRHSDRELCFGGGWFIVGIDTPEGSYTYHYEDEYFDLFDCEDLERGKVWDGHAEKDVTRLLSLQQEPSEDAISRQAVLEQTYSWCKDEFLRITNPFDYLRKRINSLPPIQPKAKVGKWIVDQYAFSEINGYILKCHCSECNHKKDFYDHKSITTPTLKNVSFIYNYCPNCGTKMESESKNENV